MAKLISQLYGELQPVICPGKMSPFKDDLSTRRHLTSLSNKPQQTKAAWATLSTKASEFLVNVYSYHLMVKSLPCRSVHRRQLLSNPATKIIVF